jgi:hypothetical protein
MNLGTIQKKILTASFEYHRNRDARLESVQIGELSFRLWRTQSENGRSMNNYLVKTGDNCDDVSYDDIKTGRVKPISLFSLKQIKNRVQRHKFARECAVLIRDENVSIGTTLEHFM